LSVQMLRPTDFFLVFRVLLMIQFDTPLAGGTVGASKDAPASQAGALVRVWLPPNHRSEVRTVNWQ
jgi:hypothetical protein